MPKFDFRQSIKHIQISKANSTMLVASALTTAIVVFSLIALNSLYKQMSYQSKVIGLRNKANKQLEANIKSVNALKISYQTFEEERESVIGTADKNSKIVLDSLPSKYDFPALATSVDGIVVDSGATTTNITGTDAEASAEQDSINPQPVDIPFEVSASGNYTVIQKLIVNMQRSIRPIKVETLKLSGNEGNMKVDISAITYYQPEKRLGIQEKVVPGPTKKAAKQKTTKTREVKR